MARITVAQAKAWAESTKLSIVAFDTDLLAHIEEEVIRRVSVAVTTTGWVDTATTPAIVQTAIAKLYVAWLYNRAYSEDIADGSAYADKLEKNAEMIITGIVDGTIEIPGQAGTGGMPLFYPTDSSSNSAPTATDTSLGPAAFSMGMIF